MIEPAKRLQHIQEYYFSAKLREVRALAESGKDIINIGIGSPDIMPPAEVLEAINKAVLEPNAHQYQSYQGLPEFRESVANFYQKQYGVSVHPTNEILPLMGSKEGILHLSLAFLNQGDEVLIPNPGYPTYQSVTKLVEAVPVSYDLKAENNWQPDFEALEQKDVSKVKLMWINYPHMPTGAKATSETYKKLIAFAKKHQILLVNDNPYSFVLNESPTSILAFDGANEVALELNSLSKSFNMAGWRVGMLLGNATLLQQVLKVKTQQDSGMFYGIQKGAIAALQSSQTWFTEMNAIYAKRRALVWEIAEALHCTYDKNAAGMFVWAKIPDQKTATEMIDDLLYNHDIFVAPGTVFGSQGAGYIRFSLCVPSEQLKIALNRIKLS